jgi:hypothetical protein
MSVETGVSPVSPVPPSEGQWPEVGYSLSGGAGETPARQPAGRRRYCRALPPRQAFEDDVVCVVGEIERG